MKFTVDNEGRFTNLNAEASMVGNDSNGEKHEATVNITLDMSDYGTTKPERVDISTLPNVEYLITQKFTHITEMTNNL